MLPSDIYPKIFHNVLFDLGGQIFVQYAYSKVVECYFHFKLAKRRKLIKYKIEPQNIKTIEVNSESLILFKHEDIEYAIEYIRNQIIDDSK
ncbi:hypothetical protein HZS_7084, partial [Henneguya salminicola]